MSELLLYLQSREGLREGCGEEVGVQREISSSTGKRGINLGGRQFPLQGEFGTNHNTSRVTAIC